MSAGSRLATPPFFWGHVACASFLILWLDVGVAGAIITSLPGMIKVGVLGLWVSIAVARSHSYGHLLIRTIWPLLLMLLIAKLFSDEVPRSGQYTQGLGYLAIAFALGSFYSLPHLRRERIALILVMAADFGITGARTFFALQSDPRVSRYLAAPEEVRATVYGSKSFAGLGGYSFAYALAATIVVLLYFTVRLQKRIWLLACLAISTILLVELSFTTAIVLSLGIGFVFLVRDLIGNLGVRFMIYAAAIIGWATGLYASALRTGAESSFVSQDVSQRLNELADFLSGQTSSGSDLGTRQDLWSDSLTSLLSNGPFGIAGGGQSQKIGGHSEWLDLLATYGVFMAFFALFFVLVWRNVTSRMSPTALNATRRGWIFFVALGVVNTVLFSTIVLAWMFLVPALAQWMAGMQTRPKRTKKAVVATPLVGPRCG